jgi:hypothetical protein
VSFSILTEDTCWPWFSLWPPARRRVPADSMEPRD